MAKTVLSYEQHPSLFKKGKLLAKGDLLEVNGTASNPLRDIRKTILEGTYETNAGYKPQSEHRVYERQRIQDAKPASYYHETAIARDIDNVKRKRG